VTEGSAEHQGASSWRPRRYRTGRADLDEGIINLLAASGAPVANWDHLFEILVSAVGLGGDDVDRLDLKITNAALREMRMAFANTAAVSSSWAVLSPLGKNTGAK